MHGTHAVRTVLNVSPASDEGLTHARGRQLGYARSLKSKAFANCPLYNKTLWPIHNPPATSKWARSPK